MQCTLFLVLTTLQTLFALSMGNKALKDLFLRFDVLSVGEEDVLMCLEPLLSLKAGFTEEDQIAEKDKKTNYDYC